MGYSLSKQTRVDDNSHVFLERECGVYSNKEKLALLKKYCAKDTFFASDRSEGPIVEYYHKTMDMLDSALKSEEVDDQIVYTIVSNFILIASNMKDVNIGRRSKSCKPLFTTSKRDSQCLLDLINHRWRINQRHQSMQSRNKRKLPRLSRSLLIANRFLLCLFGIGTVVAGAFSIFYNQKANNTIVEEKGLLENVGDWWKFHVRRLDVPITAAEQSQALAQQSINIARIFLLCFFVLFAVKLFHSLRQRKFQRQCEQTECDWSEYQYLIHYFGSIQATIDKEDQQWAEM